MKELARFIIKNRVRISNKNTDYEGGESQPNEAKMSGNTARRSPSSEGSQVATRSERSTESGGLKSKAQTISSLGTGLSSAGHKQASAESAHSRYSMTEDAPSSAEREIAMMNPDELDPTPKRVKASSIREKSLKEEDGTVAPTRTVNSISSTSNVQLKKTKFSDVSVIPDSWNVEAKVKTPIKREPEYKKRPGAKKIAAHKRRRNAMSLAVSEEEEFILRTHANSKHMSFSEWARLVMFRAMGKKLPGRKEDDDY